MPSDNKLITETYLSKVQEADRGARPPKQHSFRPEKINPITEPEEDTFFFYDQDFVINVSVASATDVGGTEELAAIAEHLESIAEELNCVITVKRRGRINKVKAQ